MKAIRKFTVRAVLPEPLAALGELVANLRWSWHEPTRELFAHIAPDIWHRLGHDPIALLGEVEPQRLAALAEDTVFVDAVNRQRDELRAYLSEPRWYQHLEGHMPETIGYFSPEFGIAAALPQYSGGLGILAGDHLKSASDLGVPIVGVGLFYRSGYFSQAIAHDGWQVENYPVFDPDGLPLAMLRRADGSPVHITLALPEGRSLRARVWQASVGRATLLLLDTDISDNDDELRRVTDRLYGGAGEHRLLQELLLGIGGVRAINAWSELTGVAAPDVFHTNEGHAGFLGLERIASYIGEGLTFAQALEIVRAGTVFTTHTPVSAGIDRFELELIERYFTPELLPGVDPAEVIALGSEPGAGRNSKFNMAYMGLRLARTANGVSKLHGEVSRAMFAELWPDFDPSYVPITSVTNGVHAPTWTDPLLQGLAWERLGSSDTTAVDWLSPALSDSELWRVRGALRERLVHDARERTASAWLEQNPGGRPPAWIKGLLDPAVLTIGFARRVPTYKRLTLMLHDKERLRGLLLHPERPIQLVIAGKSHPADDEGKRLIQELVQFAAEPEVRDRIVFLPDYDIAMAQTLYPGTDVWLNNPLRPLEACGTSGMKAALNGVLNLSILDGWWNEYFDGDNGWAIPSADAAVDGAERDKLEAESLYDLLEHHVAPRFYERNDEGVPERWMHSVRHTLATLSPELSADRMVREYVERLYAPAARAEAALTANGAEAAQALAAWKARVRAEWPHVAVVHVESGGVSEVAQVGDALHLRAHVALGQLLAEDVSVDVLYGRHTRNGELTDIARLELHAEPGAAESPTRLFTGTVELTRAGGFGYTVAVTPKNTLLASPAEMGLVAVATA